MLLLNLCRDDAWLQLIPGVRIKVRPFTQAFMMVARQRAVDAVPGPIERGTLLSAQRMGAFMVALGQLAIVDWEGIGDMGGNVIPVTDAGVEALLSLPPIIDAFTDLYYGPAVILDAEKNDSTAAPNGTGAAATTTAAPAEPPASPAPTDSPA